MEARARIWLAGACLGVSVILLAAPARAVVVEGSFTTIGGDFATNAGQPPFMPPPLIDPATGQLVNTPPTIGHFTYDTDAVASQIVSPDGQVGRYTFVQSAALSLTIFGLTYSTTASPTNPLEIDVAGGDRRDTFVPHVSASRTADATNPFAAFPELELVNGGGADVLHSGALPTSDISPAGFMDRVAFLESTIPRGQMDWYRITLFVGDGITITTVPEPGLAALAWLLGVGLIAARRSASARQARLPRDQAAT